MSYFPFLYPDEIFVSVIARYAVHAFVPNPSALHTSIYGTRTIRPTLELPSSLEKVAANAAASLGLSPQEWAEITTLFPLYSAFATHNKKQQLLRFMAAGGSQQSATAMAGAAFSRIPKPLFLRACSKCIHEDDETYGETYWRRVHQVPGIHICPWHGTQLLYSEQQYKSPNRHYVPASVTMPLRAYMPEITSCQLTLLQEISQEVLKLLSEKIIAREERTMPNFRGMLLRSKYNTKYKTLDMKTLTRDICNYYGTEVMQLMGLSKGAKSGRGWIAQLLSNAADTPNAVQVLVLKKFVNQLELEPALPKDGFWKCQNPIAAHHGTSVMTQVRYQSNAVRSRTHRKFTCTCGFLFRSTDWDSEGQPIIEKKLAVGKQFERLIRASHEHGFTKGEICLAFNISNSIIEKALSQAAREARPFPLAALQALHGPNLVEPLGNARVSSGTRNWEKIDNNLSILLETAKDTMLAVCPPMRVTRGALIKIANVSYIRYSLEHGLLPKTSRVLELSAESPDDCRVRMVRWQYDNWPKNKPLSVAKLERSSAVSSKHLKARALVKELVKGTLKTKEMKTLFSRRYA